MWLFNLIGSLGLFLLGMWLMTEGLKLAGGQALQNLLGRWTFSRSRGLVTGVLVTALVQSSSAVTVATIGFVNAGLMTFQQSVWVIFGSNVGTTMTAWLVTLFGFSLDIDTYTYPLLGIGAFMRVFSPAKRGQALGMALAGFGLLFMGIGELQSAFAGLESRIDLGSLSETSGRQILIGVGIGLALTLMTQSSSASIALILTAVASGVASISLAAAAVIGANIGTTSTALIASVGATRNARRLAWAHVLFNLITAVVAIILLPLFLGSVGAMLDTSSRAGATLMLAIFHTAFNVLGVLLMWPLEPALSRILQGMFEEPREAPRTSTLDKNVATIPDLAIRALALELRELQDRISRIPLGGLLETELPQSREGRSENLAAELNQLEKRLDGVNQFIGLISQSDLSPHLSTQVISGFSANHYLANAVDTLKLILAQQTAKPAVESTVANLLGNWLHQVSVFAGGTGRTGRISRSAHWTELLNAYQQFKNDVLAAGVHHRADIASVETTLLIASLSKRYVDQLLQVAAPLENLKQPGSGPAATPGPPTPEPTPDAAAPVTGAPQANALPPDQSIPGSPLAP